MKPKSTDIVKLVKSDQESGMKLEEESAYKDRMALVELYKRLNDRKEEALKPGDLAKWKPGLKNRRHPEYGAPVVVMTVNEPPIVDTTFESGSPYYRELLGIVVGMLDPDGDFMSMFCDRRRFEAYQD